MKTTQDLIDWLDQNGYKDGADDIRRMQTDWKYAAEVRFSGDEDLSNMFVFSKSNLGHSYWMNIYNQLPTQ